MDDKKAYGHLRLPSADMLKYGIERGNDGDFSNRYDSFGSPTTPAPVVSITAAELRIAADEMEAREVVASAKAVVQARLKHDVLLANATKLLLIAIAEFHLRDGSRAHPQTTSEQLCVFRKELQPLATSYGFKIVVIDDRTKATLVVV